MQRALSQDKAVYFYPQNAWPTLKYYCALTKRLFIVIFMAFDATFCCGGQLDVKEWKNG